MISLRDDEFLSEITMLKNIASLFIVDQEALDKNLWVLTQRSKGGLTLDKAEQLPFWRYEQFINIANKLAEEENKARKEQEDEQKSSSNFNPSATLNRMSNMANKFKK